MDSTTPVAISFSGGKSSLWQIHAMIRGILPRPEHVAVIFADTGLEHDWTYAEVDRTEEFCRSEGITFIRCAREEKLDAHLLAIPTGVTRRDHPPFFIDKGNGFGIAAHRCTREFKVAPMRRGVSAWLKDLGLPKKVTKWIGFAADEPARATKALAKQDVQWERLDFPGIRARRTREGQEADLVKWIGRVPKFSMCTICPWKKTSFRWWETSAADLKKVYEIDEAIRDCSGIGLTDGDAYLTDSLLPIERLIRERRPQAAAAADTGCDGGHCFL